VHAQTAPLVSHSRQPLIKGETLVLYEVNTVCWQMWEAIPSKSFDERFFPAAAIRVSGTAIWDLQNSRES
jgi:hypothetical protein